LAAFCMVFAGAALAQNITSGAIQGSVLDQSDKAIVGATVTITNTATGLALPPVKTGSAGDFAVAVPPGVYTIEISMANFKTAKISNVEVIVGRTYPITQKLEVGSTTVTVDVGAGGQAVMETANTSIQNTMTGRAITNLPFVSRSAILIGVLDPGAQTSGGPRNSTFEGLPKGAINITFDGINVQDNLLKSSDGFFAINDPRIDDVQEFGITTNANDPSKSGEGAVQMSYVSKSGSNAFHGGVWEYNRNADYDANYYYNNLNGLPRSTLDLNEFGYKIGGPILKDKLFFFTDFDFFQFPQAVIRSRSLLTGTPSVGGTSGSANGFYPYAPTVGSNPSTAPAGTLSCTNLSAGLTTANSVCTINTLALAAATTASNTLANQEAGTVFASTINPVILPTLAAVQTSLTAPGVSVSTPPSLWQNSISYIANTQGVRRYPDFRFDYNITKKQSLEFDYHFAWYDSAPDLLNGGDSTFPVAPFNTSAGSQLSNRNLWVAAWRASLGTNKSNELRWGMQTAPVLFFQGVNMGLFPTMSTNVGPTPTPYTYGIAGVSSIFGAVPQGRNTAVAQIHETFQWTKGTHQFTFGGDASGIFYNDFTGVTGNVSFGINQGVDPADSIMFAPANVPGIGGNDLGNAESLYASLTGRVNGYSNNVYWSPKTNNFLTGAPSVDHIRQNEFGVYGNDSWRLRPTLTFNWGLRWEYQGAPYDTYNQYFLNTVSDIWGVSGVGNLFKPGVLGGVGNNYPNTGNPADTGIIYNNDANQSWYNKYYRGLAPSVGFAWQPAISWRPWKAVFGGAGRTVIRAGYSIAYSREGLDSGVFGIIGSNPGYFGGQSANPTGTSSVSPGLFFPGSVTLPANGGALTCPGNSANCVLQTPTTFVKSFALDPTAFDSVNAYNKNLKPPMVESWQVGLQRELGPDMALEVRYQANHGVGLWDQFGLNEVNVFENGFLTEFNNADSNLNICGNNPAACIAAEKDLGILSQTSTATVPTSDYANLFAGATARCALPLPPASCATSIAALSGQVNLPTLTAAFTGSTAPSPTNSLFRNGTLVQELQRGGVGTMASILSGYENGFLPNMVSAGYPLNYFTANPLATGGSFILCNCAQSTYNALVVDFRRRLAHGLQFDANYAYARSLTDYNINSGINFNQFTTLRSTAYDKGPAPFDVRNALKVQGIWDFPFGEGRKWSSSSRIVNRIIGGWSFNSVTRWQSGPPINIQSGLNNGNTFNNNDSGVNLVGITQGQLQSMLQVNKTQQAGAVWYVPTSLLNAANGTANTAIIQPCNVAGTLCPKLFVYGPAFFEADWTLAKTTKITEHVNFEMRMEALNAFNNQNFYWACGVSTSACATSTQNTRFGQMGSSASNGAYSDINTTQFPGGRVVQLVGRVNF
ncbi:MAG: carboxypeptidase-like regulatory domain-containing protein, partial [Candidatus Acidiferrales bacterium]